MTISKVYKKQFDSKASAEAYYKALGKNKDIAGRSCGTLVGKGYEVSWYYKNAVKW